MKTKVEFSNFLRRFDTLESDLIDQQRQEKISTRLSELPKPVRNKILNKIEHSMLMAKIKLPRR